jgi:hypothetical protein
MGLETFFNITPYNNPNKAIETTIGQLWFLMNYTSRKI